MRNQHLQYPGDLGCSYDHCPNRRETRIKRGNMLPLGEIQSFSAGLGIHKACLDKIMRDGGTLLDDISGGPYTTVVAEQEEL